MLFEWLIEILSAIQQSTSEKIILPSLEAILAPKTKRVYRVDMVKVKREKLSK